MNSLHRFSVNCWIVRYNFWLHGTLYMILVCLSKPFIETWFELPLQFGFDFDDFVSPSLISFSDFQRPYIWSLSTHFSSLEYIYETLFLSFRCFSWFIAHCCMIVSYGCETASLYCSCLFSCMSKQFFPLIRDSIAFWNWTCLCLHCFIRIRVFYA